MIYAGSIFIEMYNVRIATALAVVNLAIAVVALNSRHWIFLLSSSYKTPSAAVSL
jgi:hypothetical protein